MRSPELKMNYSISCRPVIMPTAKGKLLYKWLGVEWKKDDANTLITNKISKNTIF